MGTILENQFQFDGYWSELDFENKNMDVTRIKVFSESIMSFVKYHIYNS